MQAAGHSATTLDRLHNLFKPTPQGEPSYQQPYCSMQTSVADYHLIDSGSHDETAVGAPLEPSEQSVNNLAPNTR